MKTCYLLMIMALVVVIGACGDGADRSAALQDIRLIPVLKNHYFSYVNLKGEPAFEETFQEADWFSDGLALVKKRGTGKWVYINDKGETVIDASKYDVDGGVTGFWEGVAWAKGGTIGAPYVAIGTKGEELFEAPGIPRTFFCNGTAWIQKERYSREYCLVDKNGKVVAEFGTNPLPEEGQVRILPVFCDRICVQKGDAWRARYGAVDMAGDLKVDYLYKSELLFDKGGQAVAENEEGKYGVIDMNGKVVVPFEYEKIEKDGDLYKVRTGKETGWCDRSGKMVIALREGIRSGTYFAWNDQACNSGYFIDRKGNQTAISEAIASYSVSPVIGNEVMVVSGQLLVDKKGQTLCRGEIYLSYMTMRSDQAYAFHTGLPYVKGLQIWSRW